MASTQLLRLMHGHAARPASLQVMCALHNVAMHAGLLGRLESVASFGQRISPDSAPCSLRELPPEQPQRWLFTAQASELCCATHVC